MEKNWEEYAEYMEELFFDASAQYAQAIKTRNLAQEASSRDALEKQALRQELAAVKTELETVQFLKVSAYSEVKYLREKLAQVDAVLTKSHCENFLPTDNYSNALLNFLCMNLALYQGSKQDPAFWVMRYL